MTTEIVDAPVRRGPGRPPKNAAPRVESPSVIPAEAPLNALEDQPRRSARQPFGTRRMKLSYPSRDGFHRRWFNELPLGRIDDALAAGYVFVKDREGKNVSRPVGVKDVGGALVAFLMEIPEEFYNEDQAAKQADVDKVDQAIRRGDVEGKVGADGRYIPVRGITISKK